MCPPTFTVVTRQDSRTKGGGVMQGGSGRFLMAVLENVAARV